MKPLTFLALTGFGLGVFAVFTLALVSFGISTVLAVAAIYIGALCFLLNALRIANLNMNSGQQIAGNAGTDTALQISP